MPGTLLHLGFAEEVYHHLPNQEHHLEFLSGNLIPDETADKRQSHYRTSYGITGFFVPDLEKAEKDLLVENNYLKLGMFCHLYLDYHFITDFLVPEFVWDYDYMKICNPRNDKTWTFNEFFSKRGFYSAYSELNYLLIDNGIVDMDIVNMIPSTLPKTGIHKFDVRREKSWKRELGDFLAEDTKYTGEILDYQRVVNFLGQAAKQFVTEFY